MKPIKVILKTIEDAKALWSLLKCWKSQAEAGAPLQVVIRPYQRKRTIPQNRMMWDMLTSFAEQRQWPVKGQMAFISKEDWKIILTASFSEESPRFSETLDGTAVLLGDSTSEYDTRRMNEFIEYLKYAATALNVNLEK